MEDERRRRIKRKEKQHRRIIKVRDDVMERMSFLELEDLGLSVPRQTPPESDHSHLPLLSYPRYLCHRTHFLFHIPSTDHTLSSEKERVEYHNSILINLKSLNLEVDKWLDSL